MPKSGQRSYTVPAMLLIIVVLATLIVILLTRLLVYQQASHTEEGKRLANRYNYCQMLASELNAYAEDLLASRTAADRLPAMQKVGVFQPASGECSLLLYDAQVRSGADKDHALEPISLALRKLGDTLPKLGVHDGPLTEQETRTLQAIRDGSARMAEILKGYRLPTSDQNYRQMASGGAWVDLAKQALDQLQRIAGAL